MNIFGIAIPTEYLLEICKILIPAFISIITVFVGRYFEQIRDAELKIREKKIQIYEEFAVQSMDFVLKSCDASKKQQEKLYSEMVKTFEKFNKYLLFWGSDRIIKAYNKYRVGSGGCAGNSAMLNYEKFIYALRKDIGHKNKDLQDLDLIKLFLRADQFDEDGNIKL